MRFRGGATPRRPPRTRTRCHPRFGPPQAAVAMLVSHARAAEAGHTTTCVKPSNVPAERSRTRERSRRGGITILIYQASSLFCTTALLGHVALAVTESMSEVRAPAAPRTGGTSLYKMMALDTRSSLHPRPVPVPPMSFAGASILCMSYDLFLSLHAANTAALHYLMARVSDARLNQAPPERSGSNASAVSLQAAPAATPRTSVYPRCVGWPACASLRQSTLAQRRV